MLDLEGDRLRLGFPDGWIDHHPQTRLELEQEAERLLPADVRLEFE